MNIPLLKSKMVLHRDTGQTLAKALGIDPATLSLKLTKATRGFKQSEIDIIINRYDLSPEEVYEIFFTKGGQE